jgi:glyoxylase-like metal-dependent hydrolase (beta-lactamase superfamily II)
MQSISPTKLFHTYMLRAMIALLCALGLGTVALAATQIEGQLISRGAGVSADKHRLPARAIDSKDLPHTVLTETDKATDPLPLYRLASNTYFFYGNIEQINDDNRGWNGNAGFVVTRDGVIVIDALGTPKLGQRLIATIRSITDKPIRYLIITHNHPDHAYGASAFRALKGVTIVTHAGIMDYMNTQTYQDSVSYRRDLLKADMQGFSDLTPDTVIRSKPFEAHRIRLGQQTFDVYNVGGQHSHGDLVVHQVEQNIVWISDLAFNQRTTYMGDGNSKQAIAAQTWLLENFADATLMVPGHGSAQTSPFPMVTMTREYMQQLRDKMGKMVDEGVDLYEAVKQADLPEWKDTRLYHQNHRANANFVYRERERELFE